MNSFKNGIGIAFLLAVIFTFFAKSLSLIHSHSQLAQAASISTGLVAYYTFDDGSATDSVGGNNGTISGATQTTGVVGSGALSFNGVDNMVTLPNFTQLDGASQASISMWIKPLAQGVGVLNRWGTTRFLTFNLLGTALRPDWRYGGTGTGGTTLDSVTTSGSVTIGTWQHVVIIFNNGVATTYVNGKVVGTFSGTGATTLNTGITDSWKLGFSSNASPAYFNGSIDDLRFYNRALTSQDVIDLYALGGESVQAQPPAEQPPASQPAPPSQPASQPPASPGIKMVKKDGTGNFTTVQACADVAVPGDTCLIYPGTYPEVVTTKSGGTGESSRIIFTAADPNNKPVITQIILKHSYITLDNLELTGGTTYWTGEIFIYPGGSNCVITHNYIHDSGQNVGGIMFTEVSGQNANNCVIKDNRLHSLYYVFLLIQGGNHLIEGNTLDHLNSRDFLYLFGHDTIVRRNIFRDGNSIPNTGNHPDWIQTFGDNSGESYNMLIEENWVEDLPGEGVQLGQTNSGTLKALGLDPNVRDWKFRKNVFVNVANNFNWGLPGMIWENNTFYKVAFTQGGLTGGGNIIRGDISRGIAMNNVFLAGGVKAANAGDSSGFYSISGTQLWRDVVGVLVTGEGPAGGTITNGILDDLTANGYVGVNGNLTNKALAVNDISQFVLSDTYSAYKDKMYDALKKSIDLDKLIKSTFAADYNFVAGAAPNYYAKRNDNCTSGIWTPFRFCETHGVNGGDPKLLNPADPDGPDNIPFTTDDGLKPLPGSPLCGKGYNGTDIGVYSCSPGAVFAASSGSFIPPSGTGSVALSVNGACEAVKNGCLTGTFSDQPDSSSAYLWQCIGINGGTAAQCSFAIPGATIAGDFDGDGRVTTLDWSYMNSVWGTSDAKADLNKDGKVNTLDLAILIKNWTN